MDKIEEVIKLTIRQRLLLSLNKYKYGASWRRLYSWHQRLNYSSIYQTLCKLKRDGLVSLENKKYFITKDGITELEHNGLLRVAKKLGAEQKEG